MPILAIPLPCPGCAYDLAGVPVLASHVKCPECGCVAPEAAIRDDATRRLLVQVRGRQDFYIATLLCALVLLTAAAWARIDNGVTALDLGLTFGLMGLAWAASRRWTAAPTMVRATFAIGVGAFVIGAEALDRHGVIGPMVWLATLCGWLVTFQVWAIRNRWTRAPFMSP